MLKNVSFPSFVMLMIAVASAISMNHFQHGPQPVVRAESPTASVVAGSMEPVQPFDEKFVIPDAAADAASR